MEVVAGSGALGRKLVRPVLTIGNFDGVHCGHRAILDTVIARARALGGESVLYTFDPHPRQVLQKQGAPRLLTTLQQKIELLEAIGLDVLIVEPFDREFAKTTAEYFVHEHVHHRIDPVEVYVGYDFHFGRDREGSMQLLTETGPRLGFSVTIISEVTVADRDVNSTRIRELLAEGSVAAASILLGRPFAVRGRVVAGMKRGRKLGFPTINLDPDNEIVPGPGVYVGELRFIDDGDPPAGSVFGAVTNVGVRPTFDDGGAIVPEAHLLDFAADVYGREVELSFMEKLRDEQKFASPADLERQIARDVAKARDWLKK